MIHANNISKTYGKVQALNNISFSVEKAELFGLIGPDGAGKTSLLRILTTLLLPDSGTATLNNLDVVKDYKKLRNIIGYMPGRFSLYQDLTVEENLKFFATVFGTTIEENYDLIKDIYSHIEAFKNRLAGKLSGGMKQKLALSCALIHKPKILVLDEPTTGVDAVSRKEFWEMLKKLKENDITIIVSTPYMDEASLCDRVALIQNGEILSIDTPENIVNEYEKELFEIRSDNLYKLIKDLREFENTESVFPFGQFLHYTDKNETSDLNLILKYLENKGHTNIIINKTKANIEDCFMKLMSTIEK
ncbi:MAG: ABC transporter ATP-binding protein [Saprospiraceae bacterium]|nr:ABC transporter ATP-binding protein [Saprospiraceae bacterium]